MKSKRRYYFWFMTGVAAYLLIAGLDGEAATFIAGAAVIDAMGDD